MELSWRFRMRYNTIGRAGERDKAMSVTLDLPSDLELVLEKKAQNQGLSMSDFLLRLARQEAESGMYAAAEIAGFLKADCLSPEISAKVQRLLRK